VHVLSVCLAYFFRDDVIVQPDSHILLTHAKIIPWLVYYLVATVKIESGAF
jgi:hypothetical protein